MWFFSADWHLGHSNIIKYCKRPFLSREEEGLLSMADRGVIPAKEVRVSPESTKAMSDAIIDSTNAVVGEEDTLVLIGDFCWTPREKRYEAAKQYRDRIRCKNVFLIWGNHDDRRTLGPLFKAAYDAYNFNVDGQHIFCHHYPCRSWDMAHHGSWMLYGHVHNLYWNEDNGLLMPYQEQTFREGFGSVVERHLGKLASTPVLIQELLDVVASVNGIDLTVDVGVDNVREGVPFGTPWSMNDLRAYMAKKKVRWEARSEAFRQLRPASTLKGGDPNADPKF